jgi:hypothetical protein
MIFLADTTTVTVPAPAMVVTLDGVTTVLTAFIFVCLVLPSLVKHRQQFYAALACVAGIILMHTLNLMIGFGTLLFGVATGALQLIALLLLVLCVGGLTVKELAGDMARAYEVVRRGETTKETIIPLGEQPVAPRRPRGEPPAAKVYKIEDEDDEGQVPLA